MTYDLLVVGAGFSGSVIAERAASQRGWTVLIVDRRDHIGGNAADCIDEHGVRVHRYGPHVFHTNSERIWQYVSRFTTWRSYEHRVRAVIGTELVPIPFNLTSLDRLLPRRDGRHVAEALTREYGANASIPILRLRENRDPTLQAFAAEVYEKVFLHYTLKQWGMRPEELDASVTSRIPIRVSHDDRFFLDRFQGLPRDGYSALFERMVSHPNIDVLLSTDFHDLDGAVTYRRLVYTGPIDRFFTYCHGELPYRSLRFEFRHSSENRIQPVGTVNYPNAPACTRSCEYKILTGQRVTGTTVAFEYPQAHVPSETEPYYPIPRPDNRSRYQAYAREAEAHTDVIFCGRLATYKYLNMDQAVAQALTTFDRLVSGRRVEATSSGAAGEGAS